MNGYRLIRRCFRLCTGMAAAGANGSSQMKLRFKALDSRATIFDTVLSDPEQGPAFVAFEYWCLSNLPPQGNEWSRTEHDLTDQHGRTVGRRIVMVFSDATHARRFSDQWC